MGTATSVALAIPSLTCKTEPWATGKSTRAYGWFHGAAAAGWGHRCSYTFTSQVLNNEVFLPFWTGHPTARLCQEFLSCSCLLWLLLTGPSPGPQPLTPTFLPGAHLTPLSSFAKWEHQGKGLGISWWLRAVAGWFFRELRP